MNIFLCFLKIIQHFMGWYVVVNYDYWIFVVFTELRPLWQQSFVNWSVSFSVSFAIFHCCTLMWSHLITHWNLGDVAIIMYLWFSYAFSNQSLEYFQLNSPCMNSTEPERWWISIGAGNGLVLSGTNPLNAPILSKINNAKWHHYALLG